MRKMREIEEKAKEVLRETNVLLSPVEIIKIVQFYGFQVFQAELKEKTALIYVDKKLKGYNSNKVIVYNHDLSAEDARFVVARVFGLWILGGMPKRNFGKLVLKEDEYNSESRDAQIFARSLLLPKREMQRYKWYDLVDGCFKAEYAGARFGVSVECAYRRFQDIRTMKDEGQ